jgi:UDP-N-acetylmuramate--alanine ligase
MIAQVLETGGFDPTIIVGGRLSTIGAHGKLGSGDFIVAEADESDRSFLYLSPFIAVLTNLDEEHLDQYTTVDEVKKAFIHFANKVPFYCPIILCFDDSNLKNLIPSLDRRIINYGFSPYADIYARYRHFDNFSTTSTLYWKGKELGKLRLNVPGNHNIYNAMAAVAVGLDLDIPPRLILQALENFKGTGRRFELKKIVQDIMIVDDYAHHPTEIMATLEAAKRGWKRRRVVVFQPHRFSRLSLLMESFAAAFTDADVLITTEIYAAGEKSIAGVSGRVLYQEIKQSGHKNVYFEHNMKNIPPLVGKVAQSGDLILVLGAGNIYKIIPDIIKTLEGRG